MMMMMMNLVLLLLCSGLFQFTLTNRLRNFTPIPEDVWANASDLCRKLVTLYDEEDVNFIVRNYNWEDHIRFWVGLHRKNNNFTIWSNGYPFNFSMSEVNVTDTEQLCEAIENNTWRGFPCSEKKPFMCYNGNEYILIENEPKDWCQARHYCRRHYTDLVSISNEKENNEVIRKGNAATFWIGLMHDQWEWLDKGCSTYRKWSTEHISYDCTDLFSSELYSVPCSNGAVTACARGSVRIKVINKTLNWEQALEYCEAKHTGMLRIESEQDQEAVSEWLETLYKDIPGPLWIGLRRSTVFGFWIWKNSIVTYSNWTNGIQPGLPMSNNCGAINNSSNNYMWTDENCWRELPFICEEEISYF